MSRIRGCAGALVLAAAALSACGQSSAAPRAGDAAGTQAETVQIGVFAVTSAPAIDDIVAGFKTGFLDATRLAGNAVEFVERNAQGEPGLIQSIARELADRELDMIAVVGTPAVLAQAEVETETPIVALAMGDPVAGGIAESLGASGRNVTGSIDYIDPARLLDEMARIEPGVRRLGTVLDPANDNMRIWLDGLRAALPGRDLELVEAGIGSSTDVVAAARSLGGRVDAILIGPDTTVISAIDAVAQVAADERVGLYGVGLEAGTAGVLASLGPDYREVGALAGEAAAEVHAGADPAQVPFRRPGELELVFNRATAIRLGLQLPPQVLARATVIGD